MNPCWDSNQDCDILPTGPLDVQLREEGSIVHSVHIALNDEQTPESDDVAILKESFTQEFSPLHASEPPLYDYKLVLVVKLSCGYPQNTVELDTALYAAVIVERVFYLTHVHIFLGSEGIALMVEWGSWSCLGVTQRCIWRLVMHLEVVMDLME